MKLLKDKEASKTFTKKVSEGIKQETELVGWKTKTSSEKQIGNIIYDVLFEIPNKKLEDNEDKKARTAMGLSILALGLIVVGLLIYGIFVSDAEFGIFVI